MGGKGRCERAGKGVVEAGEKVRGIFIRSGGKLGLKDKGRGPKKQSQQ